VINIPDLDMDGGVECWVFVVTLISAVRCLFYFGLN